MHQLFAATKRHRLSRNKVRLFVLSSVCIVVLLAMEAVFLWQSTTTPTHAQSAQPLGIDDLSAPPTMGINIHNPGDSSTDVLFADAFRTWRLEAAPGQSNPPALDSRGWPQGDFRAFLWDGGFLPNTRGTYHMRFNGQANVSLSLVSGSVTNVSYDSATNTTTANLVVSTDGSAALNFTSTKRTGGSATNTGITNVQLMRPVSPGSTNSYGFGTTFTTPLKDLVSKFQVIRFMDYVATNSNGQVNWSDRRLPYENQQGPVHNSNPYGWQGLGGAWEFAIQLCNETNRDCYINVPALATGSGPGDTGSYVYKLAQLFKYGSDANGNVYTSPQTNPVHQPLKSNLKLYVEYSNELWNFAGAFQQSHQNYNAAVAEVNAGASPLNFDGETNTYYWGWRRVGKRIKEISEIFRAVLGNSEMMTRVRPVLEWQYNNAQDSARQALTFLDNYYNNADGVQHVSNPQPVTYYLWGGGGAAYSGVNDPNASSIDAIYNSGLNTSGLYNTIAGDVSWARAYGLHNVAYEGGFAIGGDNTTELQKQANLDPRAKNAEITMQQTYDRAGGELLMYFNSSGSSAYGRATPDVFSQNTPKLQAIADLKLAPQQQPTNGTALPATITGNNWNLISRGWGSPGSGALTLSTSGDSAIRWSSYTVRTSSAATFNVVVNYSSSATGGLQIFAGSTLLGTASLANTGGATVSTGSFSVSLPAGVSAIRLRATSGTTVNIQNVQITSGGSSGGSGLKGDYYNSLNLSGSTALSRTDTQVDFDWGNSAPGTGVNTDNFSVRWTGKVKASGGGNYTFTTISDDGVRLWVNGQMVIDNWTDHPPTTNNSSAIALNGGQQYDIKMEFYERGGGAVAKLLWTPPGGSQQVIPQSALFVG